MTDDPQNPDPNWKRISRMRPPEENVAQLLQLLQDKDWQVRWNAAREIYFQPDVEALEPLMALLKNDHNTAVRLMAAQALGALRESGVDVPLYSHLSDHSIEAKKALAIARLVELGVDVKLEDDNYRLMIPHKLSSPIYLEIGYLMCQLTEARFPKNAAPFSDVPSLVLPAVRKPSIDFAESYPHGMKFRIYRKRIVRKPNP